MLPALSERTKSFLAVSAVLAVAVAVSNVVFGMGWVNEPGARRAAAPAGVVDTPISPAAPPDLGAPFPDAAAQLNAPAAPVAAPQPKCDVAACAAAYRSFRESDCTYMPNAGVRRLCTKGTPPQ
jgi:BA14K-like protein